VSGRFFERNGPWECTKFEWAWDTPVSNEPAHALANDDDMLRALLSLGRANDSARSVQPTLHIYNIVCDAVISVGHPGISLIGWSGCTR
jgi:hypothetical protein